MLLPISNIKDEILRLPVCTPVGGLRENAADCTLQQERKREFDENVAAGKFDGDAENFLVRLPIQTGVSWFGADHVNHPVRSADCVVYHALAFLGDDKLRSRFLTCLNKATAGGGGDVSSLLLSALLNGRESRLDDKDMHLKNSPEFRAQCAAFDIAVAPALPALCGREDDIRSNDIFSFLNGDTVLGAKRKQEALAKRMAGEDAKSAAEKKIKKTDPIPQCPKCKVEMVPLEGFYDRENKG